MTTDGGHPNYFTILGLDPAADPGDDAVRQAIRDRRREWSMQTTRGVKGTEFYDAAKRGLGLISEIERVMLIPRERERQRQEALRLAADAARDRHAEFAEWVEVVLAKGFLWVSEYEKFRGDPAFPGAGPVLRQRLEDAEKKRPAQGQRPEKDSGRLDTSTERNLKDNLRTVGQPDLYAVLREAVADVSEASPRDKLLAAADKLYNDARNTADKSRPEVGARQKLAGIARLVFGTDDLKARHDVSTRLFPLDATLSRYERALATAGAIDASQTERFLREAVQQGIDVDAARDVFVAHFKRKNWPVDLPSPAVQYRLRAESGLPAEPAMAGKVREATALMDSCRYHEALRKLRSLRSRPPAVADLIDLLISQCEKAIGESGRLCQEARAPGLDDEYRVLLYTQALKACADDSGALDALARIPPPPPRGLQAVVDPAGRAVRLTWEPAAGLSYSSVIYRSVGAAPPAAPGTWDRLVTLWGRGEWEDSDPPAGQPLWYAVYTERVGGSAVSPQGEVTPRAIVVAVAPAFAARPGRGEVVLSWTLPGHAAGLEISRDVLDPDGSVTPGTTASLPPQSTRTGSLTDRDIVNGVRYRYAARAIYRYRPPGGPYEEHRSADATADVTSLLRPEPLGPVEVRRGQLPAWGSIAVYRVDLRWPQVAGDGVVKVVRWTPDGEGLIPGQDFPEKALLRSPHTVRGPDRPYDPWLELLPLCSYAPVLFRNGRCYPGEPRHFAVEPEVPALRAEASGTSVRATWAWPDEADAAIVAWDTGAEPFDPAAAAHRERVNRPPGQREGEFSITVRAAGRLYVRVAVVRRSDGIEYITSGVTIEVDVSVRPAAGPPVQAPEPEPVAEQEQEQEPGPAPAEPASAESGRPGHGPQEENKPGPGPGRRPSWTWSGRRRQRP